jgi:tetratricopeptide (TPR) repeat protein
METRDLGGPGGRQLQVSEGQAYTLHVTLKPRQLVRVIVDQRGVDVKVTVIAPDGREISEHDSRWYGAEPVTFISESAGTYRLEIRSVDANAAGGRCTASLQELRPATAQDQNQINAEKLSTEAKTLVAQGTADGLRKAHAKYQDVLPLWRALGDSAGESQTLNSLGFIANALGDQTNALSLYDQALALRRSAGDLFGQGETLHNQASVRAAFGERQKALEIYTEALSLRRAASDRQGEAITLANRGALYFSTADYSKAFDDLTHGLPLARSAGDRRIQAQLLIGLGVYSGVLGNRQRSIDYLRQALDVVRALGDKRGEAYALANLGTVYAQLGDYNRALEHARAALPLARATGDSRGEAGILTTIGGNLFLLGQYQEARDSLQAALAILRAVQDQYLETSALINLGKVHQELHLGDQAVRYYKEALSQASGNRRAEATALQNMGTFLNLEGKSGDALTSLEQALSLSRSIGDPEIEANALLAIARIRRETGDLQGARSAIESALQILEGFRVNAPGEELRASYFAKVRAFYEFEVDLLMRLHQRYPSSGYDGLALQASERARARGLLDILNEAQTDVRQGVEPGLV